MSAITPSSTPASLQPPSASAHDHPRLVKAMLNLAHAVDHLFLLIFAAAVATIAVDFGFSKWEDLMPLRRRRLPVVRSRLRALRPPR